MFFPIFIWFACFNCFLFVVLCSKHLVLCCIICIPKLVCFTGSTMSFSCGNAVLFGDNITLVGIVEHPEHRELGHGSKIPGS